MTDSLEREDVRPDPRTPAHRPLAKRTSGHRTGGLRTALAAPGWSGWVVRGALPAALALWLLALSRTQLSRMGDLGLLQALPPAYFAALVLLTLGFVTALRAPRIRHRWPGAYVLALILVIHATPSLLYPTLRYAWAWKHVAIVDAMLRHGGTVPGAGKLDVYNQWPGFFELHALVLRATGLDSVLGYASWYPVITNLLLLGPLLMLYRSITRDRRLVWGGVWLYFSTAWVGQDYFSPQAFAYLVSLTVVALVMRQLAVTRTLAPAGHGPAERRAGPPGARALSTADEVPPRGGWRVAPFLLLLVLLAVIVSSHQLTPVMLAVSLALLALGRRNRRTVLPVLGALVGLTVLWDATVARPFVSQNLAGLITALGSPDHNAVSGLAQLGQAAPGQIMTSWADRFLTGAVLLLALAALVRRRSVRRVGLVPLLVAPLLVLLANAYDGEMLFRAYLFALPAAAFLAATLLWGARDAKPADPKPADTQPARPADARPADAPSGPDSGSPSDRTPAPPAGRPGGPVRTGLTAVVLLGLLGGMLFGYFGKESMNYFTPQEAAALRYVAATPAGSRIVSLTANEPGGELHYDDHDRLVLSDASHEDLKRLVANPGDVLRMMLERPNVAGGPTYLILTRAQLAECELTGLLPVSATEGFAAAAATAPDLRLVFSNDDSVVYQYVPSGGVGAGSAPTGGRTS
ncbi:glycosyltransferase [Kitasatospora sp. A2-31]|uniref:glycosyltransferase n=1 Tax=Kitasatospora sp. A2-31 TaxID=2916414 RepID=UPI001EEB32B4|nr:glycosyltransferase [Kitasatospora sp. A2-31]MCG6496120.1 glycosyltransferase [Kitasatospora sp. A2-31]